MITSAFCMVGGHTAEFIADPESGPMSAPPGWSLVKADVIPAPRLSADAPWEPGIWFIDPDSDTSILCCPDHQPIDINKKEGLS